MNSIIASYFNDEKDYCNKYFKILEQELINIGTDFNKLSAFYKIYFSDMREELVNEVGENCVGHLLMSGVSLKKAKSINELLHIMHQSVINNNNILESINKISSKENTNGEEITLYGEDSEISRNIYDSISLDLDCGITDIVSLKDRVIMMVRDRGHALSMEIEKENDKYYIKYFIPKICNTIMVNNLKGVKKVDDTSTYTVGVIETTKEELSKELVEFINGVPNDLHMYIEGGKLYKEDQSYLSDVGATIEGEKLSNFYR